VVRKIGPADDNQRFIAIPIASAKGNSTIAEVMVYDSRKQTLVGESVYRLANTPASGQPLKLDQLTRSLRARNNAVNISSELTTSPLIDY